MTRVVSKDAVRGPKSGEVRRYKTHRPNPHSPIVIRLPVELLGVALGDDVIVSFENDKIVVSKA